MTLYAHVTKHRDGFTLRITRDVRGLDVEVAYSTLNKRACRAIAKAYGAQPWNF